MAADRPDPSTYRQDLMKNGNLRTSGTGEGFCWHAANGAETFLTAYLVYKDPRWLEEAEQYYDFYLSKLQKDPDGYEGWIGDPISQNGDELSTDALVGDAILCAPLAQFAEIVHKNPALQERFGTTAKRYQDLATRIIWEKWNKRGCYYQDGAGWGSYHTYSKLMDMKNHKWVDSPSNEISDNLNKHYAAAQVLLRLWRITGDEKLKDRVIQICGRAKTMWRYFPDEDRIVWNYWMPHGPYDIEGRAPKSWVGVHPERPGYQAWEVSMFVEVWDSGLVFEQQDFERMIRTNHWMHEGGTWRSADGTSKAGTLWTAFARFDDTIRKEYEKELSKKGIETQVARDYFKYVTEKAPGWKRLYVNDPSKVQVVKVPLQPGRYLSMTVAIPDVVELANDDRIKLATQTRTAGKLKIELLDAAGKETLGTIKEIDVPKDMEYNAPLWDGTNPKTGKKAIGQYTVKWTLGDESRTAPVWVKQGVAHKKEGLAALQPGEKLAIDFESPLDKRWALEQTETSTEQAHSGKQSLKVGNTAQLKFGQYDDLPVKVSMWVYDSGDKHGKKTMNGPGWGVAPATGDKFCVRQIWRGYLDGDTQYAWFNTGENQWFSPHPAGVKRKTGWTEWVFDFTDPKNVKVTADGKPVKNLIAKFTPAGAIALYFVHGDGEPLYVDDITVEYPKK
jgi:hypothetical protein